MAPKRSPSKRTKTASPPHFSPPVARAGRSVLQSVKVGPLPVVNRLLDRMRLEEFFRDALPKEDGRTKLSPTTARNRSPPPAGARLQEGGVWRGCRWARGSQGSEGVVERQPAIR